MNEKYKLKISTPGTGKQAFSLVMAVCVLATSWLPFFIFGTEKQKEMEVMEAYAFASFPFIYLIAGLFLYYVGRNEERNSVDSELNESDRLTLADFIGGSKLAKSALQEHLRENGIGNTTYRDIAIIKESIESAVSQEALQLAGLQQGQT